MDKNNLYSYAVPKSLPKSRFKWLDPANVNLDKYDDNNSRGCILEVNLDYPKKTSDKLEIEKCCLIIN